MSQPKDFDRVMTLREAADLAGMHVQSLRRAYRLRELEVLRRPGLRAKVYVRASALDRWLRRLTIPASRVRSEV